MITIFYRLVKFSYETVYGQQHMLHYPLFKHDSQSLMQGQMHFTDYCLSRLPDISNKRILDIGCGNGVQAIYIHENYAPQYLYGVDINKMHIQLAKAETKKRNLSQIDFAVDNAQFLNSVEDNSFDVVICTESAHHYPDKEAFLNQIKRVIRPGGYFLIADLLTRNNKSPTGLDKKLLLFYWSRQKYRDAFSKLKFSWVKEEDLTNSILKGFQTSDNWFVESQAAKRIPYYLGRLFGWGLIKLYMYQLKHSFYYYLIIGKAN